MAMILMSIDLLPILLDALLVQHVVVVRARRRGVSPSEEAPVLDAGEGASPFIFITTPRCRHHAGAAGGGAGGRQRSPPAMPHPITLRTLRRGRRVESAEQYRIAVACGGGIRIRRRCGTSWILHFVVCGRIIGRRLLLLLLLRLVVMGHDVEVCGYERPLVLVMWTMIGEHERWIVDTTELTNLVIRVLLAVHIQLGTVANPRINVSNHRRVFSRGGGGGCGILVDGMSFEFGIWIVLHLVEAVVVLVG